MVKYQRTQVLSTRFPAADLSASYVHADWLHDWSLAAMWA